MTRDEVMALSDEELRIKAAELCGFVLQERAVKSPSGDIAAWTRQRGNGCEVAMGSGSLPDYPHDIAAAWELVEEAEKTNRGVSLFRNDKGVWEMAFSRERPELRMPGEKFIGPNDHATGDTAPLAVTRAFVLAMTQETP